MYHLRYKHPLRDLGYICKVQPSFKPWNAYEEGIERNESGVSSQSIVVVAKYNLSYPD